MTQTVYSIIILLAHLTFFFLSPLALAAEKKSLITIMEKELVRSTKELKLDVFGPPYFLAYQITDKSSLQIIADFGAIITNNTRRSKNLYIEVRIGDYNSDNSEIGVRQRLRHFNIPLEDNEDSIRRSLWLATDDVYKKAVATYLKKKGKEIQRMDLEGLEDFSKAEINISHESVDTSIPLDRNKWEEIIKHSSASFKKYNFIQKSSLELSAVKTIRYYINSEGARITDSTLLMIINIVAWTQAADGMWLTDSESFQTKTLDKMPTEEEINKKIAALAETLKNLQHSSLISPYLGPAILEPDAAGVLFHEAIGHRLEGERQRNEQEGKTFKEKVGKKILPSFISLYDDPTLMHYNNTSLFGYYKYDNEGQLGKRVSLVDQGVLKSFLMSRTPVKGFSGSNGHGRSDSLRDPIARMANLIVESEEGHSSEELKKMLIKEVKKQKKEFGLIIKRVTGGETNTSRYSFQAFKGSPTLIYKVYAKDGKEELVRGAEFVGTPLSSISKIVAVGNDYMVFNGYCGAESGYIPVSAVSPSILLSEIELQRKPFKNARLPLLSPPSIKNKN